MKTLRIITSIAAFTLLAVCHLTALSQDKGTGTLLILVTGLDDTDGQLLVALYKSSDEFPGKEPAIGWGTVPRTKEEVIRFDKVPYGKYAIAVIHDQNNDGELDKNFIGIPTEGYGFSNNAMGDTGPPTFQAASFEFAHNYDTRVIDLQYGIPK